MQEASVVSQAGWQHLPWLVVTVAVPDALCLLQNDVECDFGYERVNGTCIAMAGLRPGDCPALANKAYKVSSTHLRQVQGDVCTNLDKVGTQITIQSGAVQSRACHICVRHSSPFHGCFARWHGLGFKQEAFQPPVQR